MKYYASFATSGGVKHGTLYTNKREAIRETIEICARYTHAGKSGCVSVLNENGKDVFFSWVFKLNGSEYNNKREQRKAIREKCGIFMACTGVGKVAHVGVYDENNKKVYSRWIRK